MRKSNPLRGCGLILILLSLIIGSPPTSSAETIVCDLVNCVRFALENNREIEASQLDLETAKASIYREKAVLRPDLDLSLRGVYFNGEPTSGFAVVGVPEPGVPLNEVDQETYMSLLVNFSYPLYDDGSFLGLDSPLVAAVETQKDRQTWLNQLTRQKVIYDVTQAYLNAVFEKINTELAQEEVRISQDRLSIIRKEVSLNLKPPHDEELAQAQLSVSLQNLESTRQKADRALEGLAQFVGTADPYEITLDGTFPPRTKLPPVKELIRQAEAPHPDMGIQRAVLDRSRAQLDLNQSRRWPALSFEGSYSYADDFNPPGNSLFQALLLLEMPLIDFGGNRATVAESRVKIRAEEKRIEAIRTEIQDSIFQAYDELKSAEGLIAVIERESLQAELDLKSTRARNDVGLVGPLAVLDTEVNLLEQKRSFEEARHDALVGYAGLQQATGGSWIWTQ